MTIDLLTQNTESIIELSEKYDEFLKKKNDLVKEIKTEKEQENKQRVNSLVNDLEMIKEKIEKIKLYVIKLIITNQKIIEEEKQTLP